jgi:hypothetical protein
MGFQRIDPAQVHFTFARIRPVFSCGRRIVEDTMQQILGGELDIARLPTIQVLYDGEHYYSMNNRRLYLFKELQRVGFLKTVVARVEPVPATKRMQSKYSPETCRLQARLMPERPVHGAGGAAAEASGDDGSDAEAMAAPAAAAEVAGAAAASPLPSSTASAAPTAPCELAPPASDVDKDVTGAKGGSGDKGKEVLRRAEAPVPETTKQQTKGGKGAADEGGKRRNKKGQRRGKYSSSDEDV